jgi:hypothetical protein
MNAKPQNMLETTTRTVNASRDAQTRCSNHFGLSMFRSESTMPEPAEPIDEQGYATKPKGNRKGNQKSNQVIDQQIRLVHIRV